MLGRAVTELAVVDRRGRRALRRRDRGVRQPSRSGSATARRTGSDLDRRLDVLDLDAVGLAHGARRPDRARDRVDLADGTYDVVLGPARDRRAAGGLPRVRLHRRRGRRRRRSGSAPTAVRRWRPRDGRRGRRPRGDPRAAVPVRPRGHRRRSACRCSTTAVVADAVTDRASAARAGLRADRSRAHRPRGDVRTPRRRASRWRPAAPASRTCVAGVERGVYVQRLWYLSVVDPATTTLTGGSRDACFLIEDGRLTTPVAPARFTESVFGALDARRRGRWRRARPAADERLERVRQRPGRPGPGLRFGSAPREQTTA